MSPGFSLEQFLFCCFALLACGAALLVVVTQDIVRMAFWLVISLGSVAALFFLLQADILGTTQLLIYVGGTVVVLIFGVMLTASGPYLKIQTSAADMFLGGATGLLLLALLVNSVYSTEWGMVSLSARQATGQKMKVDQSAGSSVAMQEGQTARRLGFGFLGIRPDRDLGRADPEARLSTGYLLPFEIISIHLLVVLIGAAYLARTKRRTVSGDSTAM